MTQVVAAENTGKDVLLRRAQAFMSLKRWKRYIKDLEAELE